MASSSKSGQPSNEEKVLELAKSKPDGISEEYIKQCIPNLTSEQLRVIINAGFKKGSLEALKKNEKLLYRYKDISKRTVAKGSDNEEKIVYKIIEQAGNKGYWQRDIRTDSNLTTIQLNKVLKSLMSKKLIKTEKSVANKKRVYMLYDLEPDSSVTGGAWYQDRDFESDLVDTLSTMCFKFLERKRDEANKIGGGPLLAQNGSYVTVDEMHKWVTEAGLVKVPLTVSEIESILYTIVLDNKAERVFTDNGSYNYRAINNFISAPGIVKTTCAICPVFNRCADTGFVTPKLCNYLAEWLE